MQLIEKKRLYIALIRAHPNMEVNAQLSQIVKAAVKQDKGARLVPRTGRKCKRYNSKLYKYMFDSKKIRKLTELMFNWLILSWMATAQSYSQKKQAELLHIKYDSTSRF